MFLTRFTVAGIGLSRMEEELDPTIEQLFAPVAAIRLLQMWAQLA